MQDEFGKRMKEFYEKPAQTQLTRRVPVAIRIDGKAFHTFTKNLEKPFDMVFMRSMQKTMKYLCENIQGCIFGYSQSDEITLILIDYQNPNSSAWFDYKVQKVCSVAASMATLAFNKFFEIELNKWWENSEVYAPGLYTQVKAYYTALDKGAMFDARCFNIPKEEVANLIYWRQADATRNSIQSVGHKYFSQKELQGKSCNEIQNMLLTQRNINWNDFPTDCKRGAACIKVPETLAGTYRLKWVIDTEMPIIKDNRNYVEQFIFPHGKWIIINEDNPSETYGICSECGHEQHAGELSYCPYCGTKMML